MNSTNEYALSLLSKSKPSEGTVISTRNQYAGRGQIGSSWESAPGQNIALSIILYPTFLPIGQQFLLNQCASLAVFDLVEKHFPQQVKIKWPNDIYLNEKKVAGILIQNAISGTKFRSSVIGIGININQTVYVSDAPNPTSFKLESGVETNLDRAVSNLCHFVENRYLKLKSGNLVLLQKDYLQHLYRYQIENRFQRADGQIFTGQILGITEAGQLQVETDKKIESFGLKEIKFL